MTIASRCFVAVCLLAADAACGGSSPPTASSTPTSATSSGAATPAPAVAGSCHLASASVCEEYRGVVPAVALERRRVTCGQTHGAWSDGACPTPNILGTCISLAPDETGHAPGTSMAAVWYVGAAAPGLEALRSQCTHDGARFAAP